jgi:hypothetical protein
MSRSRPGPRRNRVDYILSLFLKKDTVHAPGPVQVDWLSVFIMEPWQLSGWSRFGEVRRAAEAYVDSVVCPGPSRTSPANARGGARAGPPPAARPLKFQKFTERPRPAASHRDEVPAAGFGVSKNVFFLFRIVG